jgi:hypothetical protein
LHRVATGTLAAARESGAQMALLIVTCVAGVFFGLYYNFFVLIPLTLVAAATCSSAAWLHGHSISGALLAIVIPAVGLQGGYMIGLTGRDLFDQLLARFSGAESKRV